MLAIPKKFFLTAAAAEGHSVLTAFDNALLKGRIGNINLLRVTSILPPSAEYAPDLVIPPGSLVPTAYGYICSDVPGELICAAVGVGFSANTFGVIMEYAGYGTKDEAVTRIESMLRESFASRDMVLNDIKTAGVDHRVEKVGCALAAVPMYY